MFSKIVKFGTLVLALATAPAAFAGGMMGMGMGMGGMGMGGMGMMGMGMGGSAMIVSNGFSSFAVPVGTVMFSGDFDDRRVIVGTGTAGTVISSSGFDLDDRRVIVNNGGLATGAVLVGGDGDDFRRSAVLSNGGVITTRAFRRFDFD